jgi:hypothetical protein
MGEQEQALAVKRINWEARKRSVDMPKKHRPAQKTHQTANCKAVSKCERVDVKSKPPRPMRSLSPLDDVKSNPLMF